MTNVADPAIRFDPAATVSRLRESLATIEWAVPIAPALWTHRAPPNSPDGAWSVATNLAHLVTYETQLALPLLRAMAAGGDGIGAVRSGLGDWFQPETDALSRRSVAELLDNLRAARESQIVIVESMDDSELNAPRTPLFQGAGGELLHSPGWVATKTFQHTWEHGNAILRVALFAPR